MEIVFEKDNSKHEMTFSGSVADLLARLDVNPETVIVAKNGTIVREQDAIEDSDNILIISVVSGG